MSKSILERQLRGAMTNYAWTLYFFTSRKRRNAELQYETHKVRFRNNCNITEYVQQLIKCVLAYQIEPITRVEDYDGFNTKVSCDKLAITNELLCESYDCFVASLANCGEAVLKNKYQGYVLDGQPNMDETKPAIAFIKMANPILPLSTKKAIMFKKSQDNVLDTIDETFCRLYLVADSVVIGEHLYNFNHAFEKLFNVEKTMQRVKSTAIQKITDAGFIANPEDFRNFAQSINARTFVALSEERIEHAKQASMRINIGQTYRIPHSQTGEFNITTQQDAKNLIKYLCYKVFEEAETHEVLEASTVTKWAADTE